MKNLLLRITLTYLVSTTVALAHTNHHHQKPIDPCKIHATKDLMASGFKVGKCHIGVLIKKEKIESSWSEAKELKVVRAKNKSDWMVTFSNPKAKKGRVLYIFLNAKGGYLAANFKGE